MAANEAGVDNHGGIAGEQKQTEHRQVTRQNIMGENDDDDANAGPDDHQIAIAIVATSTERLPNVAKVKKVVALQESLAKRLLSKFGKRKQEEQWPQYRGPSWNHAISRFGCRRIAKCVPFGYRPMALALMDPGGQDESSKLFRPGGERR